MILSQGGAVPGDRLPTGGVTFAGIGRQFALCRMPGLSSSVAPDRAPFDEQPWRRLAARSPGWPGSLEAVLRHAEIWRLRTLLAHEDAFVHRLDDHRVRAAVAGMIERGVLGLFEQAAPTLARPSATAASQTAAADAISARPPASPRSSPRVASAPAASPSETFDQAAQAAVLVAAARFGTPFCEECARRAAAKQQEAEAA